jgi:hypothetical protein
MIEMIIVFVVVGVIALGLYLMSKNKKDVGCVELSGYEVHGWDYADTEDGKEPTQMILTVMVDDDYFYFTLDRNIEFEENNQHLKF